MVRAFPFGAGRRAGAVMWFLSWTSGTLFAQNPGTSGAGQVSPASRMQVWKPDFYTFPEDRQPVSEEQMRLASSADRKHPEFDRLPWDAPCSDCFELPSRRTESSRYFLARGSGGTKFYIQQAAGALHYADPDGRWITRDAFLRPEPDSGRYRALQQPLPTYLDHRNGTAGIRLANGSAFRHAGAKGMYAFAKGSTGRRESDPAAPVPVMPDLHSRASVGRNGLRAYHAWPGIDFIQLFREGEIETDFIFRERAAVPEGDVIVFRDRWQMEQPFSVEERKGSGSWISIGGVRCWTGELGLSTSEKGTTMTWLIQKAPLLYDAAHASSRREPGIIGYRWWPEGDDWIVETLLDAGWLRQPERVFPVTVDPLLYGVATYVGGDIGFNYDPTCFDLTDYCNAFLTVTVPGKTTLTGAWFDATYFSVLMGCVSSLSDCLMREAAFQIIGPCSTSPAPGSFWSCLPPEGDSSGTCYGDSLDLFSTIACIPPSCADHVLDFEMRTFHCSCNGPNCGVICHFMEDASWKITIEGRTVEENAILSPNEPDFTICEGDTIALTPTAQWGVPPYRYQWSPGGVIGDTLYVSPLTTTTYTSVVFDFCDNTDTVSQTVTVQPAPHPAPGPFADCVPSVVLDAGAGFVAYFWPHSGETTQTVVVDAAGFYSVEVTDLNGCSGSSEPIEAVLYDPPVVDTDPDTITIDEGALAQLMVTSASPGLVNYTWSPAATLTCTGCPSPLAFPEDDAVYFVVGEQNGCIGEPDSVIVLVNQVNLVLPNAFTPNGDGLNDVFRVTNPVLYPAFLMQVFDRWGEVLFESADIRQGWDGTFRGREQETGAYVWVIRYRKGRVDGEEVVLRGSVTLLR